MKVIQCCAALLAAMIVIPVQVNAQEQIEVQAAPQSSFGVIRMQSSDGETGDIQVFSTNAAWASGDSMITMASPMMFGDEFSMIGNPQFQDELNLVPEQREQIKQFNQEFSKKMTDFFKSDEGRLNLQDPEKIKDFMKEIQEAKEAKVKDILMPHQIERLKQVSLQSEMRARGDSNALTAGKLAEALGIDEEQKKRIQERSKELKEQLEKDIAKLREEAREDLLDELTSDQRKKLNEMLGDKFEYKTPNVRDRVQRLRGRSRATENRDD